MNRSRAPRASSVLLLIGATALLVILGCGLIAPRFGSGRFSHSPHLDQGIACDSCHHTEQAGSSAGMPTYRTCLPCHGPSELREPYPYEELIQEKSPDVVFEVQAVPFDLKFSHQVHGRHGVECSTCHVDLDAVLASSIGRRPRPGTCQGCHRRHEVGSDCSTCHETPRRDMAPPSHRAGTWMRTHGRAIEMGVASGHEEGCGLCHSRSSCDGCHRVEKPADHTEFFRLRGHGLEVSMSRERCATCHRQSMCIRCHEETRPRSHTGLWGGTRSNHCLHCHESFGGTTCSVCHTGAPAHRQATIIPPPPHPGRASDCRLCHLRPPHADNGGDCTECHR